jgi:hypothetical protein
VVCRNEWKVRLETFRVPFPFPTIKSTPARFTIRLNPSESPCLPDGLLPEMDRQSAPTVPRFRHPLKVAQYVSMDRQVNRLAGFLLSVRDEFVLRYDVVPGHLETTLKAHTFP